MTFQTATRQFELWLAKQVPVVRADLRYKHLAMQANPFCFLRATYYRWAQLFPTLDSVTSGAPEVVAVGDLHLENFGTWRDGLGRLAWGINDFDEAFVLPYTHDLVRLATSAMLAIDQNHLNIKPKDACGVILEGYRAGINSGGRPFVIGEEHRWFKPILANPQRDPGLFWDRLRELPLEKEKLPPAAKKLVMQMMPETGTKTEVRFTVHHRVAGLGNLGKPRYTAIAEWHGGPVAREVKSLTFSAAGWAADKLDGPFYAKILQGAVRSPDPYLVTQGAWVGRRLSPDCRRLEVESLARVKDEEYLLHAMGFETANVHLGTTGARWPIQKHLAHYSKGKLKKAAINMKTMVLTDFRSCKTR